MCYSFVDIDECHMGTAKCDPNARCTNTIGGYTCTCNHGFYGDGIKCLDVNECKTGANKCHSNARCENTVGGYHCSCIPGFSGDGFNCAGKSN